MHIRRRFFGLLTIPFIAAAALAGTGIDGHAAVAVSPCVPATPLTATPSCPGGTVVTPIGVPEVGGYNLPLVSNYDGPGDGGCGTACVSGAKSGTCSTQAFGHALTPGASESAGSFTIPGFQAGPITTQPATENIPGFDAPAQAAAGGAAVCYAEPPGPNGDALPVIAGRVCEQLWAQILTTDTSVVPPVATTSWQPYGTALCNSLAPGSSVAAANQAIQLYSNLPATGKGTWVNGQPNQVYTGLYDAVVSAWATEDGQPFASLICNDGAASCNNYPFTV